MNNSISGKKMNNGKAYRYPSGMTLIMIGISIGILVFGYGLRFKEHVSYIFDFFNKLGPFAVSSFVILAMSVILLSTWILAVFTVRYDDWIEGQ